MINLDFKVSKVNILINSTMEVKKIINHPEWIKYPINNARATDFCKLFSSRNKEKLTQLLTYEELSAVLYSIELYDKKFVERNLIDDENYKEVINRFANSARASKIDKKSSYLISAIDKLMQTEEFEKLYADTCKYRDNLEKLWNSNKEYISNFIENIVDSQSTEAAKVFVQPPIFDSGCGNRNGIVFSRCHDFIRGNHEIMELVYLAHESMHSQVLPYIRTQDRTSRSNLHGFIQYLTDNELCSRLSKQYGVTYRYGQNGFHGIEEETFKKMYPYFIGYLYRNEENPMECIADNMKRNKAYSARRDKNLKYVQLYSPIAISNFFKDKKDMSPYEFVELDFNRAWETFGVENYKNQGNLKKDDYTLER